MCRKSSPIYEAPLALIEPDATTGSADHNARAWRPPWLNRRGWSLYALAPTSPPIMTMDLFNHHHRESGTQSRNFSKTRVRDAGTCARHASGDSMADLVRMVETMAARRCSVNQILEAVREFYERSATIPAQSVWISASAPEWRAWETFWRATKGKAPPQDRRGGWRFPSLTPPGIVAAE